MRNSSNTTKDHTRIVILYNHPIDTTRSDEQDTLIQAHFVEDILKQQGHDIKLLACDLNLMALQNQLIELKPDLVVNFTEGLNGRGEFIHFPPYLLESLKIPFTGASAESIYLTSHKLLAKQLLIQHRLPTAPWFDVNVANKKIGIRKKKFIVKSIWEHSSLGLDDSSIIETTQTKALTQLIRQKSEQLNTPCFAESFIEGREFNVTLLEQKNGVKVLAVAEIRFEQFENRPTILSYTAKWDDDSFESTHSTRHFDFKIQDRPLIAQLKKISLNCWHLFKLNGYARVDFRVNRQNKPFILEINANPCLSPDAGFMAAAKKVRLSPEDVISSIIQSAL